MTETLKGAVVIAVAIIFAAISATAMSIYFSPYRTCVQARMDTFYQQHMRAGNVEYARAMSQWECKMGR